MATTEIDPSLVLHDGCNIVEDILIVSGSKTMVESSTIAHKLLSVKLKT